MVPVLMKNPKLPLLAWERSCRRGNG